MKYLPFERITYTTDQTGKEVIEKLNEFVEPKKFGFGNRHIKEYEGSVTHNSFEINRIINYRNSFLPQIKGTIDTSNAGTQIDITMKLHVFVLVFLIFWCSFATMFFVGMCTKAVQDREVSVMLLIPLLMLLFVYILTMFGFKTESKKSKEFLRKSFEARIINE